VQQRILISENAAKCQAVLDFVCIGSVSKVVTQSRDFVVIYSQLVELHTATPSGVSVSVIECLQKAVAINMAKHNGIYVAKTKQIESDVRWRIKRQFLENVHVFQCLTMADRHVLFEFMCHQIDGNKLPRRHLSVCQRFCTLHAEEEMIW
jgi:hypothetical protein